MNSSGSKSVPVEVLPPRSTNLSERARSGVYQSIKTFYHPMSGVVILGIDLVAFGSDLLTGFLALPEACILSFILTFFAVNFIQRYLGKDSWASSIGKALLGGFLAGLPFSIAGTMLGATVLVLSGLPEPKEALKKIVGR